MGQALMQDCPLPLLLADHGRVFGVCFCVSFQGCETDPPRPRPLSTRFHFRFLEGGSMGGRGVLGPERKGGYEGPSQQRGPDPAPPPPRGGVPRTLRSLKVPSFPHTDNPPPLSGGRRSEEPRIRPPRGPHGSDYGGVSEGTFLRRFRQ